MLSSYSHQVSPTFIIKSLHLLEHLFASSPEFSVIGFPSGCSLKFIHNTERLYEGWIRYRGKFRVDSDVLDLYENSLKIFKIQHKLKNSFLDIYVRKMPALPTCIRDVLWTYRHVDKLHGRSSPRQSNSVVILAFLLLTKTLI